MAKYVFDLDATFNTLTATDGNISKAAKALCVPVHALNTYVAQHAELQAVCENRRLRTLDAAADVVLDFLTSGDVPLEAKVRHAEWALEKGLPDKWAGKTTIDVNATKGVKAMSDEELVDFINSKRQVMNDVAKASDVNG